MCCYTLAFLGILSRCVYVMVVASDVNIGGCAFLMKIAFRTLVDDVSR